MSDRHSPAGGASESSPSAARTKGLLIVVSAPSGAGKTSLVAALLRHDPNLRVSVSHTTRARRSKEVEGSDYHFVDARRFDEMVNAGEFLEHAQVFGNRYGTARRSAELHLEQGHDVVLEIDWQGAQQIRTRQLERRAGARMDSPDAVTIFVLPPSRATLLQRLENRAQDGVDAIRERTAKAVGEMAHYHEYDYLVVNDVFDVALADMAAIIRVERLKQHRQSQRLAPLLGDLLSSAEIE